MKKILGISCYYHDSAATLIINWKIVAAAQEERFNRIKNSPAFPFNAIKYCLKESNIKINELDAVVFYDKPLLKLERIIETYYNFAPKGLLSFLKSMPTWVDEKIFLKYKIRKNLSKIWKYDRFKTKLLFSEHHLSHASSAFYPSPFKKAAILTIDGVWEWCTASIWIGNKNNIKILKEMYFPHSIWLLYAAFTYYLWFRVNSWEYKMMWLAPYWNKYSQETRSFIEKITNEMIDIKNDGSIWMNYKYFNYSTGTTMTQDHKWEKLFWFKRRKNIEEIVQKHCNMALAIQIIIEEIVLKMAIYTKKITWCEYLCLAGWVALNCAANWKIVSKGIFKDIFIQPAAWDAWWSLWSALAIEYMYYWNSRNIKKSENMMCWWYLWPKYSHSYIENMNKQKNLSPKYYKNFSDIAGIISKKIADGKTVAWFQERMEFWPRALWNRSILADPRSPKIQSKLNIQIKWRESFRPFAASILQEKTQDYFNFTSISPYMLVITHLLKKHRSKIPINYQELNIKDRLDTHKSLLPWITHVDFSTRIQTIWKKDNSKYYQLIKAFEKRTNCSMILNTSFNRSNEPIVCSPEDAYNCFKNTNIDYLVIENYIYKNVI